MGTAPTTGSNVLPITEVCSRPTTAVSTNMQRNELK